MIKEWKEINENKKIKNITKVKNNNKMQAYVVTEEWGHHAKDNLTFGNRNPICVYKQEHDIYYSRDELH